MAKKNKYLSEKEIQELIKPRIDRVKTEMKSITRAAISKFYADYTPQKRDVGQYYRTFSFYNLANTDVRYQEEKIQNGTRTIFNYSAFDVGVSGSGDSDWAFDADFIHGYHGGPHNLGNGIYSWYPVPQMRPLSPWEMIVDYVDSNWR